MRSIRILIADDHPLFLDGLRLLIENSTQLELLGEARSGLEVVERAGKLQPDLILMDIGMPGISGIEATQRILDANPHVYILMLTMFDDDDSILAALKAGASGYILKGADHNEMLRAIQAASNGEMIIGPRLANRVRGYFQRERSISPTKKFPRLTNRETEVLSLISEGLRNAEIADRLVLSEKTVRNHISHIFHKLKVANRNDAISLARRAGLEGLLSEE